MCVGRWVYVCVCVCVCSRFVPLIKSGDPRAHTSRRNKFVKILVSMCITCMELQISWSSYHLHWNHYWTTQAMYVWRNIETPCHARAISIMYLCVCVRSWVHAYVCEVIRARGVCMRVGECSLSYSACKAHAPYFVYLCDLFSCTIFFDIQIMEYKSLDFIYRFV